MLPKIFKPLVKSSQITRSCLELDLLFLFACNLTLVVWYIDMLNVNILIVLLFKKISALGNKSQADGIHWRCWFLFFKEIVYSRILLKPRKALNFWFSSWCLHNSPWEGGYGLRIIIGALSLEKCRMGEYHISSSFYCILSVFDVRVSP